MNALLPDRASYVWFWLDERVDTLWREKLQTGRTEGNRVNAATIPGIGPMILIAMAEAIGARRAFGRWREFEVSVSLTHKTEFETPSDQASMEG